ncbi:M23 family metallopeptidase [Candidatus Daviesbacteria bacterium]|nr:M23 family metallopeptidase [Candidatus Daviesbacteria bacterium]
MNSLTDDLKALCSALIWYSKRKIIYFSSEFESLKNIIKDILMIGRGVHQKRFWHGSMIILILAGILTSGVFGGQSLISSSFPGIGGPDPRFTEAFEPFPNGPIIAGFQDPRTQISEKPRSEVIDYEVESGDTLSSIAQKFGISTDTIRWANDLRNDQITPGDILKILPVSGVAYTVKSGDTLESVAKKFSAEQQPMLDFPFNDVPDDLSLKIGQLLIVPDGTPPETKVPAKPKPQYTAQGPASAAFSAPGGGSFIWPAGGVLTQYFSWYHPGIDIANRAGPGIAASDGGTVIVAGWPDNSGYGNRVVVDHGNGYKSLYAHMSNIYVSIGQAISRGQLIGQMGSTGRSTGTHLHLEIYYKGVALNPLAILK